MVYYLSPNRSYGISDMSLENLQNQKVAGFKALHLLVAVPVAVFILFNIHALVSKPAYLCDEAAVAADQPCLHKGKVAAYGLLAALVAVVVAFLVLKALPDNKE